MLKHHYLPDLGERCDRKKNDHTTRQKKISKKKIEILTDKLTSVIFPLGSILLTGFA